MDLEEPALLLDPFFLLATGSFREIDKYVNPYSQQTR